MLEELVCFVMWTAVWGIPTIGASLTIFPEIKKVNSRSDKIIGKIIATGMLLVAIISYLIGIGLLSGFIGYLALALLVILVGVPWAFWASRNEVRGLATTMREQDG